MNDKAQAILGMAYGVSMSIKNWVGKHNLIVMPLGYTEMILGIHFLRKFKFFPFSYLEGIMIMKEDNVGFVGVYPFGNSQKYWKEEG